MKRSGFPALAMTALCGCIAGWTIGPALSTRPTQDTGSPRIASRKVSPRPTHESVASPREQAYFRIHFAGLPPSVVASALHRGLFKEIEGLPVGEYCYCEMLTLAVADAARKNPMVIFEDLVASRGGQMDGLVMAGLFETWTTDAPQAAIDAVLGLPQDPRKDAMKTALLNALALKHPQMAMTLYKEPGYLTNTGQPHNLFSNLFSNLAKTDLSAARSEFSTMRPGPDHMNAAKCLATAMAAENTQAAMQWAEGLTDTKEKEAACGDIIAQAIRNDPASAEALLGRTDNPSIHRTVISRNFERLMNHDPALLDRLIDENMTGTGLQTMRSNLIVMIQDPAHFSLATGILQKQPAGKNRDEMVAKFAENLGTMSPQQTHDWLTEEHEWERLPEETRAKITNRLTIGNHAETVKW